MQCETCTTYDNCLTCHVGFSLNGSGDCIPNCPNAMRDEGEQCDDGNTLAGDGCDLEC
ncbi:hypothetical protein COB52_05715 [Candidatus Kaiserbacteria bacterium]|nr:MAG: hypothetical protein COB52_05715 [Candidatus Kaiserbacteria bacterium]